MKALALLVFVGVITAAFPSNGQTASREQAQVYTETYTEHLKIPYLIIVPKNYRPNGEKWPVLLYLHGAGERGNDLAKLKQTPAVQVAEKAKDFPFIFVAPQEPDEERSWIGPAQVDGVLNILATVLKTMNADADRVYLTGLSMGGWGTWFLAKSYPDRFAAIAPLCGFPEVRWATPALAQVPTWTFQGTKDSVVNPEATENMVTAVQKLGGDPKYTPLVGWNHDIASVVYEREDLYTWLLRHGLSDRKSASRRQ